MTTRDMSQSKVFEVIQFDKGKLPESKILDHLGLVAETFEELEIGDRINDHIAQSVDEREVLVGQPVRAMALNGFQFCPAVTPNSVKLFALRSPT